MTMEELKQRNESKEFLKDLQYYLFQNKRSPKIDKLSVLLDNDEKRIAELEKRCANYEMTISKMEKGTCDICKETEKDKKIEELEAQIERLKGDLELWESGACRATNLDKCGVVKELEVQIEKKQM